MNMKDRAFLIAGVILACGFVGFPQTLKADEAAGRIGLPNPFFAMNFALHNPELSQEAQAQLLKELGYRGTQYLGTLKGLDNAFKAMDQAGQEVFTAAVTPYNIPVDPGATYPVVLKDAVRKLRGRKTLLLFQFVSKTYERSSADGDARAVELGRELADYARSHGVRLAVYPHANIWCERVDHATRIVNKCDRENLGLCFNLAHWLRTDPQGDLKSLVRQSMPHLLLVTINGTSPKGSMVTLDRSAYNVEGFLKPFIEAGYRGPIGLQCCSLKGDPRDNLIRSISAWKKISARLAGAPLKRDRSPRPEKGTRFNLPERPGGCFAQIKPGPFSGPNR